MKLPALVLVLLAATPSDASEWGSFRASILPSLTKAGCNAGACHGAATGQGGFSLSLLGYDPEEDHARITRELEGRRIDSSAPEDSLLLLKASRQIEHEGGRRLPRDSQGYARVLSWIRAGAPYGPKDLRVTGLSVVPADSLLAEPGHAIALRVVAALSDGSEEDVTALALYTSNDEGIAEVGREGEVILRGRGLTSVMVRYGGQVAAARVAVPFGAAELFDFPPNNFIDEHVGAELTRLQLPPSPLSGAAEFLRRVHLDLNGRLPTSAEVRAFLAVPDTPARRLRIIDELLDRAEFVDLWTLHWAELLLIGGRRGAEKPAEAYHRWLREQVARNTPFDELARSLLTASGTPLENPAANFFHLASDPRDLAEHASRMLLGTQIGCARCHAHPADRWTRDDYYQFAAYFAAVSREGDVIRVGQGELDHPKTGRPVVPRPLGSSATPVDDEQDRRIELARWLTGEANPMFARAIVNRVWKHLFGRGLVEPADDLRPTNPATHPALLDALAADFAAHDHDTRRLIRMIVSSRAYQLSSRATDANRKDDRFYSHAYLKAMPAQVYLDAVAQVTGVPNSFPGYPAGTRAVELPSPRTPSYALDVLGRCSREAACGESRQFGGGMAQALHMINGPTINEKLGGGLVAGLITSERTDREIIEELYLCSLSRRPTAPEMAEWEPWLGLARNKSQVVSDLLWALLNSREFAFNH